jgi:hypothetical protein
MKIFEKNSRCNDNTGGKDCSITRAVKLEICDKGKLSPVKGKDLLSTLQQEERFQNYLIVN